MKKRARECLPGTIWENRGRWNWRVRLPGTPARKNYPLRLPGQSVALSVEKGIDLAESIAWRMWEKASRIQLKPVGTTLDDVASLYLAWAHEYYRRADGSPTREAVNCEMALRPLRARCGRNPIDDIGYKAILDTRDAMIESGLNRTTINQRVGIWKRFFLWALDNRHCSAQTKGEVWAVGALKKNRSKAAESNPVGPVPHRIVKKTLASLPPNTRAMVMVQELSGMRPGEVCAMRPCDIEKRRGVWLYRPSQHKTLHRDLCRVVVLGPRAQRILSPIMDKTEDTKHLFSPLVSVRERKMINLAGETWTTSNYGQAIRYACRATRTDWNPNQLRHSCGTRVRRKFGTDAARAVLGHSTGGTRVTDGYTREAVEKEFIKTASRVMIRIG